MTAQALRGHVKTTGTQHSENCGQAEDRRALVAEWTDYAESLGLRRRKARWIVRYYIAHIEGEFDFHDWVIQYLDPTGETAVRNVMRERNAR